MSRFLCPSYKELEAYVPGEQPLSFDGIIKLNTNESPFEPSPAVKAAVCSGEAAKLNLYPPLQAQQLCDAIAARYGAPGSRVILTNGSDEALSFAFMAFCGRENPVAFADITYGFYKVYAELYGCDTKIIPLSEDLSVNARDYTAICRNIFIANPNAPTGILLSVSEIESIIRSNADNLVVIDEAYIDFDGESCAPLTQKYDNLIVIGTFSKSRSLAGARLGYMICCDALAQDLNKIKFSLNPYNINRLTLAAGLAAVRDTEYYNNACRTIIENRQYITNELKAAGYSLTPSAANFVFAAPPGGDAYDIYVYLKANGVLVRYFNQPRINNRLRITVGTHEQLQRLIELIKGRQ